MDTLTSDKRPLAVLLSEANGKRSRETITIKEGAGKLDPGTIVGKIAGDAGDVTVTKTDVGGGKGAVTLAVPAYGAGVLEGDYRVTIIEPAADAGKFEVVGPDGVAIGIGTVGVAFTGLVKFTLADAATDFAGGDVALIHVAIADGTDAGLYTPSPAAGPGSVASAVLLYGVDATDADAEVVAALRDCEVKVDDLIYAASVDDADKKAAKRAQLAAATIIPR